MDLRHLRSFMAVAEELHFGRAAERLHIVQSALSMQIRDLEEELGAALFERTSRRTELTYAGTLFLTEAERTLAQADRAKSVAQRAARGEVGSVRIGFAGIAVVAGKLPDDLKSFHSQYPGVDIEIQELAPAQQADALFKGLVDLGYAPSFGSVFETELASDVLASWPWLVAMPHDHALANRATIAADDLVDERFILYASSGMDVGQLMTLRLLLGREPRIEHRVTGTLTVMSLIAARLGIALVPAPLSTVGVPNVVYREISNFDQLMTLILLSRKDETMGATIAFRSVAQTKES